ncbi:hypothetical protein [Alkalibacillus almallahensis]|uniref:hypothetical protein n=1 Tax=Alkalibacillus almallahensis TaxID=1379154 RepID=UPI0014226A85|nr:hypothetical protein [Alkalibacillus almallahensis]NIK11161.1 hypothetical protein [Alkalibacillus almallahensis]
MSLGELSKWEKRLEEALKSPFKIYRLDNILRDMRDAYDLQNPKNHRELKFYRKAEQHLLDAEVA